MIHLHGRLGYLPWESTDSRPFNGEVNVKTVGCAMQNIKIIHEDIKDGRDADFQRAKQLLAEADQIRFLGFGFNRTNVERLGIDTMEPGRAKATGIGMTTKERNDIRTLCGGRVEFVGGDCLTVLREEIQWD